jgi:hypothetical protein
MQVEFQKKKEKLGAVGQACNYSHMGGTDKKPNLQNN